MDDWAAPADAQPILLFEAIGGTGKSILAWEWATRNSDRVQGPWAGRFWYSFYERGATMQDFCRHAMAYVTGKDQSAYREKTTAELTRPLIEQLRSRRWLFVLDGLERILVSYHRIDSTQINDDDAGKEDKIARRDPCASINPDDEDLLRALAAAHPSKLLLTSRLAPRALMNQSGQLIPGVVHVRLPGLRPGDAEALFRSCGVFGDSTAIQNYLKAHCDCHPLVIGVLAGLVRNYLPARGDFDEWAKDPQGGGRLDFSSLNLVQKRNHILETALSSLPPKSGELLSMLALLSGSVDYDTFRALNPHLAPLPDVVDAPPVPERNRRWMYLTVEEREAAEEAYRDALARYQKYEDALAARRAAEPVANKSLNATVRDLEERGLVQYDNARRVYDLHPVVRGVATGGLRAEDRTRFGRRVIDHFSLKAQSPYDSAESLEEFDRARTIVRTYLFMGRVDEAHRFIVTTQFISAMSLRLEAHHEILSVLRPFFGPNWKSIDPAAEGKGTSYILKRAASALRRTSAVEEAYSLAEVGVRRALRQESVLGVAGHLMSLAAAAADLNRYALEDRLLGLVERALGSDGPPDLTQTVRVQRFRQRARAGQHEAAEVIWREIMASSITVQTAAVAAHHRAVQLLFRGDLDELTLSRAEELARVEHSALGVRNLAGLRGLWHLERGELPEARLSFERAVELANKAGKRDRRSEIRLAITKLRLGALKEPFDMAGELSQNLAGNEERAIAELWFLLGDSERAIEHAREAIRWATADGIPHVHAYELARSQNLAAKAGLRVQAVPECPPAKKVPLPIEVEVDRAIDTLLANYNSKRRRLSPQKLR